jgi:hypothetical protein
MSRRFPPTKEKTPPQEGGSSSPATEEPPGSGTGSHPRRRLRISLASLATLVGLATGVFTLRDQIFPPESPSDSAQNESVLAGYFTTDGSSPEETPSCEAGLFNFCLDQPVENALDLLGPEDRRSEGMSGGIHREWDLGDIKVSVNSDKAGSICRVGAARFSDGVAKLAIPGPLVLGDVTMGEVVARRGEPPDREKWWYETWINYEYHYRTGPEGVIEVDYSYATRGDGPDDPGSFGYELGYKRVTGFSAGYNNC